MDFLGNFIVSALVALITSALPTPAPAPKPTAPLVSEGMVWCADGQRANIVRLMPSERYAWVCPDPPTKEPF
jgi:hypothetical protein